MVFWILMTLCVFSVYGADLGGEDVCSDSRCERQITGADIVKIGYDIDRTRMLGPEGECIVEHPARVVLDFCHKEDKMAVTKEVFGEENPANHKIIETLICKKGYFDEVGVFVDDVAREKIEDATIDFLEQTLTKSKNPFACTTDPVKFFFKNIRERVTFFKTETDCDDTAIGQAVELYFFIQDTWGMIAQCLHTAFCLDDAPSLRLSFHLMLSCLQGLEIVWVLKQDK